MSGGIKVASYLLAFTSAASLCAGQAEGRFHTLAAREQRSRAVRGSRWRRQAGCVATALLFSLLASLAKPASAQIWSERYSAIVLDAASGSILYAAHPDELRFPASLTKLMTIYMLFEALRDRRVFLDDLVPVSAHAASAEPSKLGLVPGTRITVEEALLGLVTKSANDAASALGEMMAGGDEERFAQMMTLRARALGMTRTTFHNASGLPDPDQVTTAEDMAILARRLVQDFPQEYRYFSVPGFLFRGRMIPNHDHMLQTFPGADGLKTGFTNASGYNLVTSAVRGGVRLVGVVLGAGSGFEREQDMTAMLNSSFERMGVAPMLASQPASPRFADFISAAHAAPLRAQFFARRAALPRARRGVWGRAAARVQQVALAPFEPPSRGLAGRRMAMRLMVQPAVATMRGRSSRSASSHFGHHRVHG
jgi:D-alanyl-D-alanine carboxypeptidase